MRFFKVGGTVAWRLILGSVLALSITALAVDRTARARYERDVSRMVFNDNLELLNDVRRRVGATSDSLNGLLEGAADSVAARGSIVVSIADHRLWYRLGDTVVFETRVATGSGKELAKGGGKGWKFETPRGRLVVLSKESDPTWVPPDWHFVEVAKKKHLRLTPLIRGKTVDAGDGSTIAVSGNDVVRRLADGSVLPFEAGEGKEIIVKGMLIVPPFGTNQRRFAGVVGTQRLNLGDGYALHGTDVPSSIGQSVSHGCVRLRNEDIETLFRIVPIGTPVYIY
jgi:L,D-transpeptidase catalytic domain